MSSIIIKGNKDGIMIHINSGDYSVVKNELIQKIEGAKDFFSGSRIVIVDDKFKLEELQFEDLKSSLKETFNISISASTIEDGDKNEKFFTGIYEGRTKFLKNTVRSGQKMVYNGNIVVIGDVNSGAEVVATGNIIVLGVLRGIAEAGSNGNKRAFIAAYRLQPELMKIGDIFGRSPDTRNNESMNVPELAKIKGDIIMIEPYLPNKYL